MCADGEQAPLCSAGPSIGGAAHESSQAAVYLIQRPHVIAGIARAY